MSEIDASLSIGDLVRVIGPSADSSTFALGEDTKIVAVRYSGSYDARRAFFACPIDGWGVVNFPATSLQLMRRGWEVALRPIDDAMREQVMRDLLAGIAETQAEIRRLEAFLADVRTRETDEEPAAMAEGEAQE